jgi:galactonate dehydratase
MRITGTTTFIMESPGRDYLFVKVQTDDGTYGWGEGTLEMKQGTVAAAIRDLQGFIIGEDPTRIDYLWQRMYRHGFWRGGEAILTAVSAIEMALWDITGKAFGQPVYRLLGGAVRDYIPCYTHFGSVEQARALVADGWTALKSGLRLKDGGGRTFEETSAIAATGEFYEATRAAVGPDVALMCDVHGRLRPAAAIRLGRTLDRFGLAFLEEAVPPDNVQALRRVRDSGLSMDLATGERAFTKWGFRELIEGQLVDVIQPDLCHDGGIKETLKIAAMAEVHEILVAPHNPNGPVGTAASVHLAAVIPNLAILEYAQSPTRDACQAGPESDRLTARNGRIALPTKPGLGIDLDESFLTANPHTGVKLWPGIFHADGGVADV